MCVCQSMDKRCMAKPSFSYDIESTLKWLTKNAFMFCEMYIYLNIWAYVNHCMWLCFATAESAARTHLKELCVA